MTFRGRKREERDRRCEGKGGRGTVKEDRVGRITLDKLVVFIFHHFGFTAIDCLNKVLRLGKRLYPSHLFLWF